MKTLCSLFTALFLGLFLPRIHYAKAVVRVRKIWLPSERKLSGKPAVIRGHNQLRIRPQLKVLAGGPPHRMIQFGAYK